MTEALGADARFYVASFSCRTIVYKGLMMATEIPAFYPDLNEPLFESALAVVHQRYSTNTFPSWELAQPFRYLAHNGEINTLRGNLNWMRSRERSWQSDLFGDDIKKLLPVIDERGSDSACLDNALELLTTGGRDLQHAMLMLIPQAWGAKYPMGPDLRGFFEYHAGLMEPWDGPAARGLHRRPCGRRPARPQRAAARALHHHQGRLHGARLRGRRARLPPRAGGGEGRAAARADDPGGPGRSAGCSKDVEIKTRLARRQPYRRWVEENKIAIHGFFGAVAPLDARDRQPAPPPEATSATRARTSS